MTKRRPLYENPRYQLPPDVAASLEPATQVIAAGRPRWKAGYTIDWFIRVWAATVDDIGSNLPGGADYYLHELDYRVVIEEILAAAVTLGLDGPAAQAAALVHELDQVFMNRSRPDDEGLILNMKAWRDPTQWFLQRLPDDPNVVDHLRQIQPRR